MKKILMLCLMPVLLGRAVAGTAYTEVDYQVFRMSPESCAGKNITYTVPFIRAASTLAPHMERSGYRGARYVWLLAGDQLIPVLIRKSDETMEQVAAFKSGDIIRVSGKVRRFSHRPLRTGLSQYFVLADAVEVVAPALTPRPPPRSPPRRWWPRR